MSHASIIFYRFHYLVHDLSVEAKWTLEVGEWDYAIFSLRE